MLHKLTDLKGFTMNAKDGEIGEVEDFYFDDERWTVRYLVVDTGKWVRGRKVLISPISLGRADRSNQRLNVELTKKQIEESPSIDTAKPVSRQYEASYFDYYGYPYYWAGPFLWGPEDYPAPLAIPRNTEVKPDDAERVHVESGDPHLHSANDVNGYYIEATDGEIGHLDDFIVDDENWAIRYIVVDTRNWWPGKKVIVAPQWIERVSWRDSSVYVNVSRNNIQAAPEYHHVESLSREYETALHEHYGRAPYWRGTERERKNPRHT